MISGVYAVIGSLVVIWLIFIITACAFDRRTKAKGEARLISACFTTLTFFFPPFAVVPIILNLN